jgi:uncharacterized membrane protein (UPF0182 family)
MAAVRSRWLSGSRSSIWRALPRTPRLPGEEISYIRNSVEATVDAYDGTVTLYATGVEDPVLQAWMNVFPAPCNPAARSATTFANISGIPRTCSRCSARC